MNHQRPLRVNRHRKHIAAWSWGFSYDPATQTFRSYVKRNGLIVSMYTTQCRPLGIEFPDDVQLKPLSELCPSQNTSAEPSTSPKNTEAS